MAELEMMESEPLATADGNGKETGQSPGPAALGLSSGRAARASMKSSLLHNDMHENDHAADQPSPSRGRISRTILNFWLDVLLAINFVTLCITAVIVQFVFPPGISARGVSLWGMSYGQWCSLQFSLLAILALAVLLHVMLHWTWVCSVLTKRILKKTTLPDEGIRTIYGVGLFICLLLLGAITIGAAQWMIVLPR